MFTWKKASTLVLAAPVLALAGCETEIDFSDPSCGVGALSIDTSPADRLAPGAVLLLSLDETNSVTFSNEEIFTEVAIDDVEGEDANEYIAERAVQRLFVATKEGTATVTIADAQGEELGSAAFTIVAPDALEIFSRSLLHASVPEENARVEEIQIAAQGLASFDVRLLAEDLPVNGGGAQIVVGNDDDLDGETDSDEPGLQVVSLGGVVKVDVIASAETGKAQADVLSMEVSEDIDRVQYGTIDYDVVGTDSVQSLEITVLETNVENGTCTKAVAVAKDAGGDFVFGPAISWSVHEEETGDIITYPYDAKTAQPIVAAVGDIEAEATIHSNELPTVHSSSEACSAGGSVTRGLFGLLPAAIAFLATRRKRTISR